jgi:hypothetical protein
MSEEKKFHIPFKYQAIVVTLCVLGFGYFAWHSYNSQQPSVHESDLPLIKAPTGIKSKPKDPGGIVIPNRDKDIYDHISGKQVRTDVKTRKTAELPLSKTTMIEEINRQLASDKHKKPEVYTVRLAKLKSADVLSEAWEILRDKYGELLTGLKPQLMKEQKADGPAYYLHAGPITLSRRAVEICNVLTKSNKQCVPYRGSTRL